jgi:hypothetical protein
MVLLLAVAVGNPNSLDQTRVTRSKNDDEDLDLGEPQRSGPKTLFF